MKKFLFILLIICLTGCSTNKKSGEQSTNVYMNTDSNCVGTKRIDKDYKITDPHQILKEVDYCFIGTFDEITESKIYDDGRIKTKMLISIQSIIKGKDIDNELEVYKDGGRTPINSYINYPEDTYLSKNSLKSIPENMRAGRYVEIIPTAYFEAEQGENYLFFVSHNDQEFDVYNDAYGMLKVIDEDIVENMYTNEQYQISDFQINS